ncbi:TlpA disulfide reductase family protein [Aquimarina sp. I32.4]|uniref:TlpA family protein disulfide reductase n=1 Tax=Aquimarina sp. I32.4 TaxID=2053903 RepID=UPI000CDE6AEA|nr:TlpA disulfide reductase family protein [Aquimarina sp. I32.4]
MKIKQLLLALSSILIIAACNKESKKEKVDYTLFSGKIKNTTAPEIIVFGNVNNFKKAIPINEDGTFSDTLKIESKGIYSFMIGRERSNMYLDKGDQLELSIDPNQFDESIVYTGNAADVNNYLAKKALLEESFFSDQNSYKELFSNEANTFKNLISEQEQAKNNLLKKYKNMDAEFATNQAKENHYQYLALLSDFKMTHAYYTQKQEYKTPEGFTSELNDFDLDNAEEFKNSEEYRNLSLRIFDNLSSEKAKKDSISFSKAQMENLAQIKTKDIKDAFIKNIATQISPRNDDAAELYKLVIAASDNEEFKKELTSKFEKIKRLTKGKVSPTFSEYENYKGGKTSLSDLKGKYVYIDVWATWCGPCKAEIPHLKKIEKEYHNKNIEFVSISIDKRPQYEAWKKMVEQKELGGIQLFADNNWNSQFVTDYGIRGIPRFILIDPDGNIVSASAPRPSEPRLKEILSELKI